MNIVISQPMYFPWVGMLEQINNADIFVHYSDVQFVKGSFFNRVQIKLPIGTKWLTVPLRDVHLGQKICEVQVDEKRNWKEQHIEALRQAYRAAPFKNDMLNLVESVFVKKFSSLGELATDSTMALAEYFNITTAKLFFESEKLEINGSGSKRVCDICNHFDAKRYITGHGASKYLDHELFDKVGIEVNYMQYEKRQYPQLHGEFTPFVSALDLVANCGRDGADAIKSGFVNWRDFLKHNDQNVRGAK